MTVKQTRKRKTLILRIEKDEDEPIPEALLEAVLQKGYAKYGKGVATVNLRLVGDRQMRQLQRNFTGRRGVTDVLAFEDGECDPSSGLLHLGDIAVDVEVAKREAEARHRLMEEEVALYALHGLLHLLGMRDDTEEGQREMARAQRAIFSLLHLSLEGLPEDR